MLLFLLGICLQFSLYRRNLMASINLPLLCFSVLFLFHYPLVTDANLHRTKSLLRNSDLFSTSFVSQPLNDTPPTVYFEVTKPIKVPKTTPCLHRILRHDFGYTYGKPPVVAKYTPPTHCPSKSFSKVVLEWKATCKGRQFDRIFGVWLDGVELLRSCTAEPRANGTVWSVKKDVTRYYSLLMKNDTQNLAVYLGNLVDRTYTGVYHVDVNVYYYPAEEKIDKDDNVLGELLSGSGPGADLILPISRNLALNDGLWFEIKNSVDTQVKEFKIPQNVYRAVLEVYVSFHEKDEFWYGNPPNDYLAANNLTNTPGNGPFREVVVTLDNEIVGAVWPFTVVYTGGINPLLWRPITGIGSFDLPSYDIEITPFLGNILDGETHKLGFSVTNALNVWYIDANLHLWLDGKSSKTEGKLLSHISMPLRFSLLSNFTGLDGTFLTNVNRSISSTGWVKSSYGNITTDFIQDFSYSNSMVMAKKGDMQIVNQMIHFNDSVSAKSVSSSAHSIISFRNFTIYLYTDSLDLGNETSSYVSNVTLGFDEDKSRNFGVTFSDLKNLQDGQGSMVVKGNLVKSGLGSTQQAYNYRSGEFCYLRNISSSNYTILYDQVDSTCNTGKLSCLHSGFTNGSLVFI